MCRVRAIRRGHLGTQQLVAIAVFTGNPYLNSIVKCPHGGNYGATTRARLTFQVRNQALGPAVLFLPLHHFQVPGRTTTQTTLTWSRLFVVVQNWRKLPGFRPCSPVSAGLELSHSCLGATAWATTLTHTTELSAIAIRNAEPTENPTGCTNETVTKCK